jgi:aquaporin Z
VADTLRRHYPEYLMEAAGLALFMVSACGFGTLLWHPASPVAAVVADGFGRRALMGLAMGMTFVAIAYSPWGQQSGAHLNPSVTLTFWRLGKVSGDDAAFYVVAQFLGGLAGVLVSALGLGRLLSHPAVGYVTTVPGRWGVGPAFAAEVAIAFLMMTTVLVVSNSRWGRWTALCAGVLVLAYITFETPISGMSLNPARTLGSALPAHHYPALWVYFTAPFLGMLLAAEVYGRTAGARAVHCAKLHHDNPRRCIFCQETAASAA